MIVSIFRVVMLAGVGFMGWFFREIIFYLLAAVSVGFITFTFSEAVEERGQIVDYLTSFLVVLSFLVGGLMLRGR